MEGLAGYPVARNLCFSNIRLMHAALIADVTKVSAERPVEGLKLAHISGVADRGMMLVHVRGAEIRDVRVTGLKGALLATEDVTGTGLEGAVAYQAPPAAASGSRGARCSDDAAGGGAVMCVLRNPRLTLRRNDYE